MNNENNKEKVHLEDEIAVLASKKILFEAIEKKASDILIEPLFDGLQIRYKIDGIFYKIHQLPLELHPRIITHIKAISNLNIAEHRLPQEGRFRLKKLDGKDVDIRVSIIPSTLGEKVALRIFDRENVELNLDRLGFDEVSLRILKKNLKRSWGIILICGPAGSGKTTTLYSCLKFIDSIEKNIITIEDPIEYDLYGINQVNINEKIGLTFASVLRSVLRQDPDIILVGEMRDVETVEIALRASLTGHLVLSTLHTTTASAAIVRLKDMGAEPFLIASSLLCVCAQNLLRILCKCKEPFKPSEEILNLFGSYGINIERSTFLYQKKGCSDCNYTGYRGRKAVGEVLEISPSIKEMINEKVTERELQKVALGEGLRTLKYNALEEVKKGITSLEEVFRVLE